MTRALTFIAKLIGAALGGTAGGPGIVVSIFLLVWAILDVAYWIYTLIPA